MNTLHAIAPANRPTIGAVAVLPYFKLQGDDQANIIDVDRWDVNSESFETKTRAALMYYDQYMKDQVDYQYYVDADKVIKGGSGYCIELRDGKEHYCAER